MPPLYPQDRSLENNSANLPAEEPSAWDYSAYAVHVAKQESDIVFNNVPKSEVDYAAFAIERMTPPQTDAPFDSSIQEDEDAYVPLIRPVLYRLPSVNPHLRHTSLTRRYWARLSGELPQQAQPSEQAHGKNAYFGLVTLVPQTSHQALSRLNAISMVAVSTREETGQQQDAFISDWVEDIARKDTLILPVMSPVELQAATDEIEKRKAVASTAGGAAIAGAADAISAVLRYVITVLMTNLFPPAMYGIFVEANTVTTVLGYASKLGLDSTLLRFLPAYRAKGERGLATGMIRFALLTSLISGLIWGVAFFALAFLLVHSVFHKDIFAVPFREAALLVPFVGIQLVLAAGLQAMKAIKWKVCVDRLIQPVLTLILLIVFYLLGLKIEALIYSTVLGYLASIISGYVLFGKMRRKLVRDVKAQYDVKTWATFALPMFFNSMIRNILNSTDVLFLGILATQAQIAFYGAADRVSYFVVAPLIALNAIFSPIIAEYHAKGKTAQLENLFKVVTKWSFSLSWPVFLCFTVFHDPILGIFGKQYTQASEVLFLLSLGNLVDAGVGSVNYLLVMTGRPRVILFNTVSTVVLNVTLALLLVPRFNIVGAALAAALAVIILNIVGLIEVYWYMKIHPYRWDILKPVLAGAGATLVGLFLTHLVHVGYGHKAIFGVLALVIPFMLVYVGLLALLRFSEEDKIVFETVRAKFSNRKKKNAA